MGRRVIARRRGSGSPAYAAPSHRFKYDINFRRFDSKEKRSKIAGEVVDLVKDRIHSAILMKVLFENNEEKYYLAPEGIKIGDRIEEGINADLVLGSVLPLSAIPEGSPIYNIEIRPGDGGKLVRGSGGVAYIRAKEDDGVHIKLPSKRIVVINEKCRAQLGLLSMGARTELPLMKAGTAHHKHKARNHRWPVVRGVAMNPVDHPHGGKQHHVGKPTTVSRRAPPGQKVGHIAARTTGRRTSQKMKLKNDSFNKRRKKRRR